MHRTDAIHGLNSFILKLIFRPDVFWTNPNSLYLATATAQASHARLHAHGCVANSQCSLRHRPDKKQQPKNSRLCNLVFWSCAAFAAASPCNDRKANASARSPRRGDRAFSSSKTTIVLIFLLCGSPSLLGHGSSHLQTRGGTQNSASLGARLLIVYMTLPF